MLLTLVPLFDENMAVCAYSFFTQRENYLLNPLLLGTAQFDGASQITGLELIQKMGIDTLSQGKEIFVPITNISIFADITEQCDAPHEKIVLSENYSRISVCVPVILIPWRTSRD